MLKRMLAVVVLVLGAAGHAEAVLLPYSATFTLELGSFPPVQVTSSGQLDATVDAGSNVLGFTVPQDVLATTVAMPITPPIGLLPPFVELTGVSVQARNGAGALDANGGLLPLEGVARLLLHAYSASNVASLPLTGALGSPGSVSAKILNLVPISIVGNGWTTGVATAISTPLGGTAAGAIVSREGAARTTSVSGSVRANNVTYVTPTQVVIPGIGNIAVFGTLAVRVLHEVPEPGTLLLFTGGMLGLTLLGGRKRR